MFNSVVIVVRCHLRRRCRRFVKLNTKVGEDKEGKEGDKADSHVSVTIFHPSETLSSTV